MKTKRKFFPANTADIPAIESWLEDMALEGLFPLSFNSYYAKFRQGEPQKLTYRIEIPKYFQGSPPKAMRETYGDFGWQFVCSMWQKYYLFVSAEECPMELHTDPLVQSELFEEAYRDYKRELFSGLGVMLVFFLFSIVMVWSHFAFFISSFSIIECLTTLLVFSLGIGWTVWEAYTFSRLRRGLASGVPLEHRKNYRKPLLMPLMMLLIFLMPALPALFDGLKKPPQEFTAAEITSPLPCLPLAEIEGAEERRTADVTYRYAVFAPTQYRIREYGEGSSLIITYMEVRPRLFAAQTMKTLADNGKYFIDNVLTRQEIKAESGLFDGMEYYHSGNRTIFAARKGNAILKVEYQGSAELSGQLPAFAALLEQRYAPPET